MQEYISLFIKRSYKLLLVVIFLIIFFIGYNTYIVERSLVNLRVALASLDNVTSLKELEKIKPFLKLVVLKEISKIDTSSVSLTLLESVTNTIDRAENLEQIDNLKFLINIVIEEKSKIRGNFLTLLDHLNSRIYAPETEVPRHSLEKQAKSLISKIEATRDKTKDKEHLQNMFFDLGNIYLQLEDIDNAKLAFLKVVEIEPENELSVKAQFNLAWAYKSAGRYQEAIFLFNQLAEESELGELSVLSQYQLVDILFKKGEYKAAAHVYEQLSSEYPEFSLADLALYEAAQIYFYYLDNKEEAYNFLVKLEKRYPKSRIVSYEMSHFRPALAYDFILAGYRLLRQKEYRRAIEYFEKAIKYDPQSGIAVVGAGLGYYWLNMKDVASEKARQAIRLSPEDERVLVNALFILINSNQLEEAIKIGEEALLRKSAIKSEEFHYNLGYAYIRKAEASKAKNAFRRTIKLNPDFIYAYNNLGCSYWVIKDYAKAIKKFREAIALDPTYIDAYFNLGVAYYHINQLQQAFENFRKVLELDPNYWHAKEHLEQITRTLGYTP